MTKCRATSHRRIAPARAILILCLAVLPAACATDGSAHPPWAHSKTTIKHLVIDEAMRLRVPTSLALAVAHAESNFEPRAESAKGARGVMQIMPATAWGEYGVRPRLLWNARVNVRVGLHFLRRLLDRYRGRVDLALSYYNGGSAVGDLPHARVIPATYRYVAKVRRLQRVYRARLRRGEV